MQEIINSPFSIIIITLFIGMIIVRFQYQQKRKKERDYGGKSNSNKSRRYLEIETLKNRLDKLEVDVAYMKDFTIKKEAKEVIESTPIDKKVELKSDLVNLIKKEKKTMQFSDKIIKAEIERKCADNVYTMNDKQYKHEYKKAYQRLWARKKYNSHK
jgi:hypothetical protein